MSNQHRGYSSEPNARGMWMRRGAPERFPTFAGQLPVLTDDPDDLSLPEDETEEAPRRPDLPVVGQPLQNREGATSAPAPRRATRRPRPSPLFGEGELDASLPSRETLHMEGRQSTLWETEITDAGQSEAGGEPWHSVAHDESITLEVDPQWRARIAAIDAAHEADAPASSSGRPDRFTDIAVIERSVGYSSGAHADDAGSFEDRGFDTPATDDLSTDDLVYDADDARNRRHSQTPQPAPLPAEPVVHVAPLAARAPAPSRSLAPHVAFPRGVPTIAPASVGATQRLVHATEALAWFTLGAVLFSGTGASVSLLVVAMLFAG